MASEEIAIDTSAAPDQTELPLVPVYPPEKIQRTLSAASSLFEPLEPRADPLGVFPQYVSENAASLKLIYKARGSGLEGTKVTDANGEVFRLVGHPKSLRQKMSLLNARGEAILNTSARLDTVARQFIIRSGAHVKGATELARIKSHLMNISINLDVTFTNAHDGNKVTLKVEGDRTHRSAIITLGGVPIARVRREWETSGHQAGARTFYIRTAARVDTALIVAIVACMEQRHPYMP